MNYDSIGEFLRIIRKERHISQEPQQRSFISAQKHCGILKTVKTETDTGTLFRLCDLYGISGHEIWLFYERDNDMDHAMQIYHIRETHVQEYIPV